MNTKQEPIRYQSLEVNVPIDEENSLIVEQPTSDDYSVGTKRNIFIGVFLVTFVFYGYCVFYAFSPSSLFLEQGRRILEEDTTSKNCTISGTSTAIAVGAAIGSAVVLGTFLAIGLSPIGPIAGGLFAANMGAAVSAGSWMAVAQSAAMTGTAYATGAGIGAATGASAACA